MKMRTQYAIVLIGVIALALISGCTSKSNLTKTTGTAQEISQPAEQSIDEAGSAVTSGLIEDSSNVSIGEMV